MPLNMTKESPQASHSVFHLLLQGDPRKTWAIPDESVHMVLTSPPCWPLELDSVHRDLGWTAETYDNFLGHLDQVWEQVFRVLVPGGRMVCVVGDIWLSRKDHGRHRVIPYAADISIRCRNIGFDNLNPIIWQKSVETEQHAASPSTFLGSPYEPNAAIRKDVDYILMQRKPGGYRKPTAEQRERSRIEKAEYHRWFQQCWTLSAETRTELQTPFPARIAERLIRMFSFWGDTVLDPFCGTGTTLVAAMNCHRSGIGIEPDRDTCRIALNRVHEASNPLFNTIHLECRPMAEYIPHAADPPTDAPILNSAD